MGIASSFKEFPCEYKVAAAVVAVTVVVLAGIGSAYALSSSITVENNAMLSEGIAIDVYEGGPPIRRHSRYRPYLWTEIR